MKQTASPILSIRILKIITAAVFCLVLVLAVLLFSSWIQKPKEKSTSLSSFAMGSLVQQTVYGDQAEAAVSAASSAIISLENQISWRVETSDIHKLNAAAGTQDVALSKDTANLLEQLLDVSRQSHGAFDITIAPLSLLWNFDEAPALPSKDDIRYFRQFVGYENLFYNAANRRVHLEQVNCAVDLGAAGKGAACDAAMEAYAENGVDYAVIMVGSSVGLYGIKSDGTDWNIEIRDPKNTGALGVLHLTGGFLSTSSSREKYIEENGITYHHILDPETGYPAESGLLSVTVVADSGALSDALATACFVLGYDDSLPLLEHYGAEAVFVIDDNRVLLTDGLTTRFDLHATGYSLNP